MTIGEIYMSFEYMRVYGIINERRILSMRPAVV